MTMNKPVPATQEDWCRFSNENWMTAEGHSSRSKSGVVLVTPDCQWAIMKHVVDTSSSQNPLVRYQERVRYLLYHASVFDKEDRQGERAVKAWEGDFTVDMKIAIRNEILRRQAKNANKEPGNGIQNA